MQLMSIDSLSRIFILAALSAFGLGNTACTPKPNPVVLSEAWPQSPGKYHQVHSDWTRRAVLRQVDEEILEVYATFKSPAWRAAYIAHTGATRKLPEVEQKTLREEHGKVAAEFHEVHLLVTTWDRKENDLQKGAKSVWRLSLRDDQGGEVEPESVTRDKRPQFIVQAEYPDMGDFATAYIVRFPHTIDVLRQGAKQFSLVMSSSRGAVELVWQGR